MGYFHCIALPWLPTHTLKKQGETQGKEKSKRRITFGLDTSAMSSYMKSNWKKKEDWIILSYSAFLLYVVGCSEIGRNLCLLNDLLQNSSAALY